MLFERSNLVVAEITARGLGPIDLADALELPALVAMKNRTRSRRMAARWMSETAPAIDEAVMVPAASPRSEVRSTPWR